MDPDHATRIAFARDTLEGLSVGDAMGEAFSYQHERVRERQELDDLPPGCVNYTDDSAMALGVFECLSRCHGIDEDVLAGLFSRNYQTDPERGYGKGARRCLSQIAAGIPWMDAAGSAFGGGSFGNGSAMRVGPVGSYFFDDLARASSMASSSARVTHAHPEGIAGAIAVAVACAAATTSRHLPVQQAVEEIWDRVLAHTPAGDTAQGLAEARRLPICPPASAARILGCGYDVSCQDTVPFTVWNALRCLDDFREALLSTVEVGGDCDTNAAIVCSIVASRLSRAGIPARWLVLREKLPLDLL